MVEKIPADEEQQIQRIVQLTLEQLKKRYPAPKQVLRAVHPKHHGCASGRFRVLDDLPSELRVGLFSKPGRVFPAWVRFSNADPLVKRDSDPADGVKPIQHGSRGMAVKLLEVEGEVIRQTDDIATQDFLMVNQPVFAFANVEDYEVLSRVLVEDGDVPGRFFAERLPRPGSTPSASELRALKTLEIVQRVKSPSLESTPPAFQKPPASPVDNDYFGAAPFLFGSNHVMRFRACPDSRSDAEPDVSDPDYLRAGLIKRLDDSSKGDVVFHFDVQVRPVDSIDPEVDTENASLDWPATFPYVRVAELRIPCQRIDTEEAMDRCEKMVFTPWHTLPAHRPLGGINRMRLAVYEASAEMRNSTRC